jgi:hypothetical protein
LKVTLTEADLRALAEAVPAGSALGDRYPVEGMVLLNR